MEYTRLHHNLEWIQVKWWDMQVYAFIHILQFYDSESSIYLFNWCSRINHE